jgi:hypothetical protein
MYTVNAIKLVSAEKPTQLLLSTDEEFDVHVIYRYGIMIVLVNDDELHKAKLTKDYTDSKMKQEDIIEYLEEFLPEELLNFSLIKKRENEHTE